MRLFKNCSSVTCVRCAIVKHGDNTTNVQSVLRKNE